MTDQQQPINLIGVYNADGGFKGELQYFFGHLIGTAECTLCDVTHSPIRRKPEWDKMVALLAADFSLGFSLLHRNERSEKVASATTGREPCVLGEYADGNLTMLLDSVDLKAVKGDVKKFEKVLRARLALFF
jgi:hypothetical protein